MTQLTFWFVLASVLVALALFTGTATAEAIRKMVAAMQEPGGMDAVNLKVAEQYIAAFGNIAKQGNMLILPGDLSNMSSMVAAAMQVVKQGKRAL